MNRPRHPRPVSERLIGWGIVILAVVGSTWMVIMLAAVAVRTWREVLG